MFFYPIFGPYVISYFTCLLINFLCRYSDRFSFSVSCIKGRRRSILLGQKSLGGLVGMEELKGNTELFDGKNKWQIDGVPPASYQNYYHPSKCTFSFFVKHNIIPQRTTPDFAQPFPQPFMKKLLKLILKIKKISLGTPMVLVWRSCHCWAARRGSLSKFGFIRVLFYSLWNLRATNGLLRIRDTPLFINFFKPLN